jgi:hypothetical protein
MSDSYTPNLIWRKCRLHPFDVKITGLSLHPIPSAPWCPRMLTILTTISRDVWRDVILISTSFYVQRCRVWLDVKPHPNWIDVEFTSVLFCGMTSKHRRHRIVLSFWRHYFVQWWCHFAVINVAVVDVVDTLVDSFRPSFVVSLCAYRICCMDLISIAILNVLSSWGEASNLRWCFFNLFLIFLSGFCFSDARVKTTPVRQCWNRDGSRDGARRPRYHIQRSFRAQRDPVICRICSTKN